MTSVTSIDMAFVFRVCKMRRNFLSFRTPFQLVASGHRLFKRRYRTRSDDQLMKCSGCKQHLTITGFIGERHGKQSVYKRCYSCRFKQRELNFKNTRTLSGFCTAMVRNCRINSKRRLASGRILNGNVEISREFLMNVFEKQNGLGYLSKMPLVHSPNRDWQMSPHRLDNDVNYTCKNTVLEALEFNHERSWTAPKMELIPSLLRTPICDGELKEIAQKILQDSVGRRRREEIEDGDIIKCKCFVCGKYKPKNDFPSYRLTRCKECLGTSPYELAGKMVSRAKHRHLGSYEGPFCLSREFIADMFLKQHGRGYYSGLPMWFRSGNFQVSCERLNNQVGYTEDNVVLETWEFNTVDVSGNARNPDKVQA